ncbi:MAG: phosphoenolpyruvate hydrolase family protein [Chloroflexi bacterium]|nr:phosphoenolpyruvate hydrolase family protein [Chloroflexota bacterium]
MVTPERAFTRATILERLKQTLARGEPIIAVGAGSGIVAKCAEVAGADLIVVLCTGVSRMQGLPTTVTLGNATAMMLSLYPQIDNVVERTSIIAGVEATDPTRRRLPRVLDELQQLRFDGVGNFPSVGAIPSWGLARSDVGQGIEREYELLSLAHARDLFTIGFAFSEEHARGLTQAGADVIVARCGLTVGGMVGPKEPRLPLKESLAHVQAIVTAAQRVNPSVFCLAHGGPFARPDDTEALYAHTDVHGFFGESAIERIPIEERVAAEIAALKGQRLRSPALI